MNNIRPLQLKPRKKKLKFTGAMRQGFVVTASMEGVTLRKAKPQLFGSMQKKKESTCSPR
jgi:hypothetical protein